MFKIESYITPILLSYVDKYVKDFKPADAQVSLWGGGVVLHNLVLKTDVVQQEVPLPFTLVSGRIHELLIQVPWTKIMSEPIVVTIDTIECILNQRPANEQPKAETPSGATQVVEAPPGYMQALVRRIVSNIAIRIHHLIVKYVQDDIVLSLNVKHLSINSTAPNWEPAFADIDSSSPAIRRLIVLDDLTLCLDNTDADGKIRFYQDPLLYRCGLEFRVLAKLVSANTRRASSFDVQMSTTKIAWGVTSAQLLLLLRLVKERAQAENETPSPTSAQKKLSSAGGLATVAMPTPPQQPTANAATEPSRRESWSDWAWSWKSSSTRGKEEATMAACPTPITFSAFLDEVSLVIKVLETEANTRKRSRSLLELTAAFTAIKCWMCAPTLIRAKLGIRSLVLKSTGKCTCGHHDFNTAFDEPTIYLSGRQELDEEWHWPKDKVEEVEVAQVAEEVTVKIQKPTKETIPEETEPQASTAQQPLIIEEKVTEVKETEEAIPTTIFDNRKTKISAEFNDLNIVEPRVESSDPADAAFWKELSPVIHLELVHERSPPNHLTNPYDNPPKDFEYSDWEEQCDIHIHGQPINLRICMGLIHRLVFIKKIFDEVAPPPIEPMRVLTVEECEALNQNLPQRRYRIDVDDFRIDLHPWDHSAVERPVKEPLLLRIEMPKINVVITAPLYPQRVCSAAGQLPEDAGVIWRGCRMHTTAALNNIKISVCSPSNDLSKPCGRISVRFVTHVLLYPEYFEKKRSVRFSYAVKISELNVSGSAARLHAAAQVVTSLINERISLALRQTSLAKDALADEDLVALDITAEEFAGRGYVAKNVITHIITLKSLRATVFQSKPNKQMQQAWLFSGPDVPTTSSYVRLAIQLCDEVFPGSIDFIGLWTEPTAFAIDPLLASWLSYKPTLKQYSESNPQIALIRSFSSTQHFAKKQTTPPSSSGRGLTRSGTASAEVHYKSRSRDSNSELSEKKESKTAPPAAAEQPAEPWWVGEQLLKVHERLKKVLICVEFGLALIYVPTKTATAVGCETVRVAMENHASFCQAVVVYSLGRWSLHTNNVTKHLWHVINHEGPTFISVKEGEGANEKKENSFPWNMLLADMTCYTLEALDTQRIKSDLSSSLRSQLKETAMVQPRTILELVSTNIALSVVTKSLQHKMVVKAADTSKQTSKIDKREAKLRYFTTGTEFKPTTFVEFLRGPTRRKKDNATQSAAPEETQENVKGAPVQKVVEGPIVSLGFNMHADTPPIVFRFEYDQVQLVSVSLHCINHVIALLKRNPVDISRQVVGQIAAAASRTFNRSEMDEDFMTESDQRSDDRLMTIFTVTPENPDTIKAFFWFQWVISRVTAVVTIEKSKLALDIDDVSMSIDLQEHYKQLKIKINSIFVKNFEQFEDNSWVPGAFGGRVLDAREPTKASDDPHFLIVTITAARISTLPESWKEELHPKLLEHQTVSDTMWEVYTVLASLEVVLVPAVLRNIMLLNKGMSSHKSCSSSVEEEKPSSTFDLPYCYLSAGGLKMLVASSVDEKKMDDTFVVTVGKISVNPHPDNPICRRPTSSTDVGWSSVAANLEGRQYEVTVRNISIETAEFGELATEQKDATESKIANENPAVKWSKTVVEPTLSPILHPLDIDLLLAPALYTGGSLVCGPALELNLTSDCVVELNIDQLALINSVQKLITRATEPHSTEKLDNDGECPYLMFFQNSKEDGSFILNPAANQATPIEDDSYITNPTAFSGTADSGMETATTQSTYKSTPFKKRLSFSVDLNSRSSKASDYLEVFLTTGTFEISLYTHDDGSNLIQLLRHPDFDKIIPVVVTPEKTDADGKNTATDTPKKFGKLQNTESIRHMDFGKLELKDLSITHLARNTPKSVPLLHATFHQPNLYYWKRKSQKNLQISLFNVWFGLGMGLVEGFWRSPIVSTARGFIDPVTEIPPALATMKYTSGSSSDSTFYNPAAATQRGTLNLDVERPIHITIPEDNVRRLALILNMVQTKLAASASVTEVDQSTHQPMPNKIRKFFINNAVEVATIRTSQIGLSAAGATLGLDNASFQMFLSSRRDQLSAKGLISALMLNNNALIYENNLTIFHPTHIGIDMNFFWEAWQRAEGGLSANEPSTRILLDMDSINIDLAPQNLAIVENILKTMQTLRDSVQLQEEAKNLVINPDNVDSDKDVPQTFRRNTRLCFAMEEGTEEDHFYKDDLRSGAFKILSGNQMPMAYQVVLNRNGITWRYPHPRAITKLVAYPIPNQDKETDCMLEFYSLVLNQWEPYIHIKLPVSEPREIILHNQPPELIFSTIWRIHTLSENEKPATYQFNINKYLPTGEPTWLEDINAVDVSGQSEVTAEQLSGILRVDSYFGPRYMPRFKLSVRFSRFDVNVCNALPQVYKQAAYLEGYYVSKPLMCAHRVLTISALNAQLHCRLNALAGSAILFHTLLSSEIVDCSTGTMEHLANDFKLQAALSIPENMTEESCIRLCTGKIRLSLYLSRLRTLQSLASDWSNAIKEHLGEANEPLNIKEIRSQNETAAQATHILEGRVSLWIHNSCSVSLRMGQEDTDEVFPLGPGAKLAYRWKNPSAKRRMRFAIINPTGDWRWSNCVTFALGESRVRMEDAELAGGGGQGAGVFIHVTVTQSGAHRLMRLSGRLVIANMLKLNLLYKVRARLPVSNTWSTVSSGELSEEAISRSVISATNCEMVLKVKFNSHDTGWSGDIPLKECPKENVPWLVKVPSQGTMPYVSVWCRVIRARSDGRIFAAIWPLYVLTSNLTLDTDVLLDTDLGGGVASRPDQSGANPPPMIQSAPGRGVKTHLFAPGTTSAKHSLSFQYRNVECPVTREAVPLHYGVTDTSVFDKRVPVNTIEEVVKEVDEWLKSSRRQEDPEWPHSIVSKHFRGEWKPALLQPRCDVAVRYHAIRVGGGGCSLEVELNPVLLICNAAPISVTLRAHDAAPLCKLDPATIISPPSIVLKKPFFMSMEKGRETFVSPQIEVCSSDPGRYGAPPPGQVAVDHPALFAIPYHDEVTILSLHYELKEDINVMGITAAFVFVNNLDIEVSIATTAVPEMATRKKLFLQTKKYDVIQPSKTTSIQFTPLYQFLLYDRWLGGNVSELALFLSVRLPEHPDSVPVELGTPPYRRPLTLRQSQQKSIAAVLTQHKHEGRWIATLSPDPCPQYLVNNKTSYSVAVAQPHPPSEDAKDTVVRVMRECAGVDWWCHLHPGASIHYSSPGYTFGDALPSENPPPITWLTFADYRESDAFVWCPPVAISAGEQRVQLSQAVIVKLHVRPHLHSTLVELRDITDEDISAKDIRKRLLLSDRMDVDDQTASNIMIRDNKLNAAEDSKDDYKKLLNKANMLAMRNLDMKQLEKELHDFLEQAAKKEVEITKEANNNKKNKELSSPESSDNKELKIPEKEKAITIDSKFVEKSLTYGVTDTPKKSETKNNVLMDNKFEEKGIVINENAPEKKSNVDKTSEKSVDTPFSVNNPQSTEPEKKTNMEKTGEKGIDTPFSENTPQSTVAEKNTNVEKTGEKGMDTSLRENIPQSAVPQKTTNMENTGETGKDSPFSENTPQSAVPGKNTNVENTAEKGVVTPLSENTPQSTVAETNTNVAKTGEKGVETLLNENTIQSAEPGKKPNVENTGEKGVYTPLSEKTPQSAEPGKNSNVENTGEKGVYTPLSEKTPQSAEPGKNSNVENTGEKGVYTPLSEKTPQSAEPGKNSNVENTGEKGVHTPLSEKAPQSTEPEKNTNVENTGEKSVYTPLSEKTPQSTVVAKNTNVEKTSEKAVDTPFNENAPDKNNSVEKKTNDIKSVPESNYISAMKPRTNDQNIMISDKIDSPERNIEKRVTIVDSTIEKDAQGIINAIIRKEGLTDTSLAKKEKDVNNYVWEETIHEDVDRVKCMISSIAVEMSPCGDTSPLLAIHVDRTYLSISTINKTVKTTVTVMDVQIDNLQYESGQYDFAVVAATRAERTPADVWPSVWNMFTHQSIFDAKIDNSRILLKLCQESWSVLSYNFTELTEIDFRAGPLALYIEDAYIAALVDLMKLLQPPDRPVDEDAALMAEARSLQKPLRLQQLHIQPLDLTLTLHTAVRIYIALDQSPLHLNAFKVQHMFTTTESLAHALTVHYLSAAILSAGWVVGGLELLGAPGALAARVGGATGGVRGIASTTAAALLRSLSACAGSLARNLDLLAGDEEHAKRAAAARRRPPSTFVGGLVAGFTNFAINILGAVGGLAHHPLVGVAVGETESSAAALRRSLLGALTKPLSATADLVAYAGHGLLTQTGWDPVPQPRVPCRQEESYTGWRRDCVRWAFRLAELRPVTGFEVLLQDAPMQLIVTFKFLVFAEPQCERVVEMIDLRHCYVGPYLGGNIELCVTKTRLPKSTETKPKLNEDEELYISEAAMQRVARFAGVEASAGAAGGGAGAAGGGADAGAGEGRVLTLVPAPGQAHALHALLLALTHANASSHFPLI